MEAPNSDNPTPPSGPRWRRPVLSVVGFAVLGLGVVMLVTPGPGLVMMAVGLAVLGREYHWARRLLERVQERIERAKQRARRR